MRPFRTAAPAGGPRGRPAPSRPRLVLLLMFTAICLPPSLDAQPVPSFQTIDDWAARLKFYEAQKGADTLKLFQDFFFRVAGSNGDLQPPFRSAESNGNLLRLEDFLRRYVIIWTRVPYKHPHMKFDFRRRYAEGAAQAGRHYLSLAPQWWIPERHLNWEVVLRGLQTTYDETYVTLAGLPLEPGAQADKLEELLDAYSAYVDCTGKTVPKETAFLTRWRQLVRIYAGYRSAAGTPVDPSPYLRQVDQCERAARLARSGAGTP